MLRPTARRLVVVTPYVILLGLAGACGGSPTAPDPVLQTENLTGTLQPLGVDFKTITIVYTQGAIFQAFITTAGMFGAMSVYGLVTKRDLTSWGAFFTMGLIGILICMVVNMFLKSSALGFAVSVIGVVVFVGLTAYDTQKLKAYATAPELRENLAVYGALRLYLDFVNLFLMLLRLFGGNRR